MNRNKTNLTKLHEDILYIRRLYYISRLHLGPLSAAEIAAELRMRKMWPPDLSVQEVETAIEALEGETTGSV